MPAEIGKVKPKRQTHLKQVALRVGFVRMIVNINGDHTLPPGAPMLADVLFKIVMKIVQSTLQRLHGPRSKGTKRIARAQKLSMHSQQVQVFGPALALLNGL
jgi:hypothetical protein